MVRNERFPIDLISTPLHETLLGTSSAISQVNELIKRLANSNLTVLITGESGTGKDISARLLHKLSPRAAKPFIKVNCPALPESILESELFGYEKGAFTGARSAKPGRLELAHTGTLFLDEVAETSSTVQGKLLQLLDGEPVMRIGGVKPINSDVRVVAATNMDLDDAVRSGRVREDLYFRLSEIHVQLPSLRDRVQDIPLLAEHFNYNYLQKAGKPYDPLPTDYVERMKSCAWRGNVRELEGCVKKYVTSGNPDVLLGEDVGQTPPIDVRPTPPAIPRSIAEAPSPPTGLPAADPVEPPPRPRRQTDEHQFVPLKEATRRAVEDTERRLIEEALNYTLWNRRKAARLLDISYSSLLRRIDAYKIGR